MAKGKYSVEQALACIIRNGGVIADKAISFPSLLPGIRVWGVVDFLVNYEGYRWVKV